MIDGEPYVFGGECYEGCSLRVIGQDLGNLLMDMGVSPLDVRRAGDMALGVIGERSFSGSGVLCFDNGYFSLSGFTFEGGFSPAVISTERMGYRYDEGAKCPMWDSFLSEVLPDAGARAVLQEFFGMVYLDRGRLSVEKMAFFVGKGANGKSVVFEVMKRVLGEGSVSTLDPVQLSDEKMLPSVKGKRLNFSPDLARHRDFSSSLKALASGQDVTGRRIYGEAEKVNCPPLAFAMNDVPALRDVTDAFFRRVLYFGFDVQIPAERQDRLLVGKICASDLPGIFNWVIEGTKRLLRNRGGFTACQKMDRDLALLRSDVGGGNVRAYLEGRGLSVVPAYPGQSPTLVSCGEIVEGLGGAVSPNAVSREMSYWGVVRVRNRETFYKLYKK